MTKHFVHIKCPYCGNDNVVMVDPDQREPIIVLCDIDESPGCDRYFAARVDWTPSVRVFEMREAQ